MLPSSPALSFLWLISVVYGVGDCHSNLILHTGMVCHVLLASHMWPIYLFTPGVMRGSRCVQQPAWFLITSSSSSTLPASCCWPGESRTSLPLPLPGSQLLIPPHQRDMARWRHVDNMAIQWVVLTLPGSWVPDIYLWCSSCHVLGVHSPSHQNIFNFLFMPFKSYFSGNYSGRSTAWVLPLIGFT